MYSEKKNIYIYVYIQIITKLSTDECLKEMNMKRNENIFHIK